ncbi:3-deoxy-D-manno-octulosonic acid transferase [Sulfitobacter sabulilitoris]|uniref:3-deoxy-D-manno-octulosonic acid transferase n=1 Tax=Sulfitobacter sabulilitoris TaxID=2562655 RepID=A0A5S3PEF7_9RHOB|nr:glycosyltransferase N-terminal domain-containing protein [Sulfitobacter sabulilitoris]TMM52408.1 3-deoxy-D-manno-octulosonic acid transferase [Sulfitobacter sabulilitoris]
MGRSPGLAAYRAWTRRADDPEFRACTARPAGEMVWLHAPEPGNLLAIHDLAQRLCAARYDLSVLITLTNPDLADATTRRSALDKRIIIDRAPSEHPECAKAFVTHWAPDMGIWSWGGLRPNLIQAALDQGCAMVLIDADTGGFDGRRDRWLPDVARSILSKFSSVLARSTPAARRLEQLGLDRASIQVTPPLQAGGQALPCDDADVTDLSSALAGRPVWLANAVQMAEVPTVLSAHRTALRLSHRLLLILHPAPGCNLDEIAGAANKQGFRTLNWDSGSYPDDSTQILLADDPRDLGLFYRVAPVAFLGSSLSPGHGGCDPFEAAALGSAVLYGPNVRRYMPFYTRLAQAGAARIVNDSHALGTAVTRLIAPDQAATMAHAGWDVISQGAALTDTVIDLVQEGLDARA